MFEDKNGEVIYEFPHVSGFPLESMHVIDGGVFEDVHTFLEEKCRTVRVNPSDPNTATMSILDTDVQDRIAFLNKYKLIEQARSLRYV